MKKDQHPEISYPCRWDFKLIGRDEAGLRVAAEACLAADAANAPERQHRLEPSRSSRDGNYISLRLRMTVQNQQDRDAMYQRLVARPEITLVI